LRASWCSGTRACTSGRGHCHARGRCVGGPARCAMGGHVQP
jgi:hypothetical protein